MKKIPLTQGRFALVDDEDYSCVNQYRWCAKVAKKGSASFYAMRTIVLSDGSGEKRGQVLLHRFITGAPQDWKVDHLDGDGLNCKKSNLRFCSQHQNNMNRRVLRKKKVCTYKGVTFESHKRKDGTIKSRWRAGVRFNKKLLCLGQFENEELAARAYDKKAKELFGDFAHLNFPGEL